MQVDSVSVFWNGIGMDAGERKTSTGARSRLAETTILILAWPCGKIFLCQCPFPCVGPYSVLYGGLK